MPAILAIAYHWLVGSSGPVSSAVLGDRLRRQPRIDAGRAEEQQLLDAGAPRRLDDVASGSSDCRRGTRPAACRWRGCRRRVAAARNTACGRASRHPALDAARAGAGRPSRAAPSGARSPRAARRRTSALPTMPRWPATQTRLLRSV